MSIVLDTHVWIWLVTGNRRLSGTKLLELLERESRKDGLLVPAICAWEAAMLSEKGRLQLLEPAEKWIFRALSARGLNMLALTPDIACESVRLPGSFHGDPADRLITASARIVGAKIATFDRQILSYAEQGYVEIAGLS